MYDQTFDEMNAALQEIDHVPMIDLLDALAREPWVSELAFTLSMYRLWIARRGKPTVEVIVAYGDGRGGGRPSEPWLDAYDFWIVRDPPTGEKTTQGLHQTVELVRQWHSARSP